MDKRLICRIRNHPKVYGQMKNLFPNFARILDNLMKSSLHLTCRLDFYSTPVKILIVLLISIAIYCTSCRLTQVLVLYRVLYRLSEHINLILWATQQRDGVHSFHSCATKTLSTCGTNYYHQFFTHGCLKSCTTIIFEHTRSLNRI